MTERPILFSAPMVRAILEGRKTQTRLVVKMPEGLLHKNARLVDVEPYGDEPPCATACFDFDIPHKGRIKVKCPYGCPCAPGDRLWVRETHGIDSVGGRHYRATTAVAHCVPKWKPSILMRRDDSRITLEVTGVWVERVRYISMADVLAEGCILSTSKTEPLDYQNLWDTINAKRGYGWDVNPWVWVIEFRRIEQ